MSLSLLVKNLREEVVTPARALRARYLPLLTIYFAQGASGLAAIAENFWVKDKLGLSAEGLVALGVWLTVPWTIKMVFGQCVDCIPLFGSRRRAYVFLGAGLIAIASLMLSGAAGGWLNFASPETFYIGASILAVVGLVIQDVVADTMTTEVVQRTEPDGTPRDPERINQELGMIQVLGRLSLAMGAFSVAGLGGWLAHTVPVQTVFLISMTIPVLSVMGAAFVRLGPITGGELDWRILGGGIVFGIVALMLGISQIPFGQEIVFAVSLIVVVVLLRIIVSELSASTRRHILFAAIVIFVFRAMPGVGPGNQWWQIDELGFDPAFFGVLGQIGAALAIAGTWVFGGLIARTSLTTVLLGLTIIYAVMALPNIALVYGLHEWTQVEFGFGARTIAILDSSLESPFAQLSMIPLLTLIAIYAPPGRRATWFALMASLMNLALNAGGLVTKYLNNVFVIERGQYEHLGSLLIVVTIVGLVIPAAAILLLGKKVENASLSE